MSEAIVPPPKPRSDLGIRTISGVAMMAVAIAAIWYGGYAFMALAILVGLGVYWEFSKLVLGFTESTLARVVWLFGGLFYVGLACFTLLLYGSTFFDMIPATLLIAGVIGTDVGAYFVGRTLGGPKIAPRVSPSKTWSGLFGGMIGAALTMVAVHSVIYWVRVEPETMRGIELPFKWSTLAFVGGALAVVAQIGDFFESWMKRRAGVKDSGNLIPGHGGLFDRTDGLIAVAFVAGLITLAQIAKQA